MAGFAASVKGWSNKAKRNTTLVQRRAVDLLVRDLLAAGRSGGARGPGLIPIDTGNLRNSLLASTAAMPQTTARDNFADPMGSISMTVDGWQPERGETLYLGWQAGYARRINYGFSGADSLGRTYNQAGYFFRETYASKWPQYVAQAASEFRD